MVYILALCSGIYFMHTEARGHQCASVRYSLVWHFGTLEIPASGPPGSCCQQGGTTSLPLLLHVSLCFSARYWN